MKKLFLIITMLLIIPIFGIAQNVSRSQVNNSYEKYKAELERNRKGKKEKELAEKKRSITKDLTPENEVKFRKKIQRTALGDAVSIAQSGLAAAKIGDYENAYQALSSIFRCESSLKIALNRSTSNSKPRTIKYINNPLNTAQKDNNIKYYRQWNTNIKRDVKAVRYYSNNGEKIHDKKISGDKIKAYNNHANQVIFENNEKIKQLRQQCKDCKH